MAKVLGTPFMPWQQLVADVALEIDPATGLLAYRRLSLLVPRQSGKTTLILAKAVHRARAWATPQNIAYAAQTRNDARKKWEDDHVATLNASAFGKRRPKPYRVRKTNGNEAIMWNNGSRHGIVATTEKSGHGPTLDEGYIDEAFAQADGRLEQAFSPAMITRPDPQLWVVSTAGRTPEISPYLWGKVEAGRERCLEGRPGRSAYFEWSAADGMDRADPATWWATMPALGHTVTLEAVAAEFDDMEAAEFDRAYLNLWNPHAVDSVIPMDLWVLGDVPDAMTGTVDFAVDTTPDRSFSAVAACGRSQGWPDKAVGEIVRHDEGTGWVKAELVRLQSRQPMGSVVIHSGGPAAALITDLKAAGLPVVALSDEDYTRACGSLLDGVVQKTFLHRSNVPGLDIAAAGATRQKVGDRWKLSRRQSTVDICPLVAICLARWGHLEVETAQPDGDFILI